MQSTCIVNRGIIYLQKSIEKVSLANKYNNICSKMESCFVFLTRCIFCLFKIQILRIETHAKYYILNSKWYRCISTYLLEYNILNKLYLSTNLINRTLMQKFLCEFNLLYSHAHDRVGTSVVQKLYLRLSLYYMQRWKYTIYF